jgi:AraC-like DNA-binding protein
MMCRTHQVKQHRSAIAGIEAMTLVSNHHFPRHSHDQFGIGVMSFGSQRSWSTLGQVDASAGDVIMVNPGEMHDGHPPTDEARGWRMLYLSPSLLAQEVEEEIPGGVPILRPVVHDPLLARHFERIFASITDVHSEPLEREEDLLQTLIYVLRQHAMTRYSFREYSPCVAKAISRIDSDPEIPATLAELAALSKVSRFQLLRGFAREVGTTPHAYLVQRRIRLVRQLLAAGETPAEAATQAGFADQSHMTRAFVRQLGITPSRYRAAIA